MRKLFIYLLLISTFSIAQNKNYKTLIDTHRKELNNLFKSKKDSPLPKSKLKNFRQLPFFNVDEKYVVKAKLKFTFNTPVLYLKNTEGTSEAYQQYATASFDIDGKSLQLSLYQSMTLKKKKGYENYLFVPFADLSNGKTTYKGGRYLDTTIPEQYTGYITLDFNKAYNPYCAYNKKYICPIPPKSNHLNIEILAGVKY